MGGALSLRSNSFNLILNLNTQLNYVSWIADVGMHWMWVVHKKVKDPVSVVSNIMKSHLFEISMISRKSRISFILCSFFYMYRLL